MRHPLCFAFLRECIFCVEADMNALGISCCVAFFVIVACQAILLQWHYSRRGNWRWLERRYPAPAAEHPGRGYVFLNVTMRVNQHWYCPVSRLSLTSAGLTISMHTPLLRCFHRPFLIPWDDVTVSGQDADGSLLLDVGDSTKLTLTGNAALGTHRLMERIAQRAGAGESNR
jgi:hypothetical protein